MFLIQLNGIPKFTMPCSEGQASTTCRDLEAEEQGWTYLELPHFTRTPDRVLTCNSVMDKEGRALTRGSAIKRAYDYQPGWRHSSGVFFIEASDLEDLEEYEGDCRRANNCANE